MNFEDVYSHYMSNRGRLLDLKSNKIINDGSCSETLKKLHYVPVDLVYIKARNQALDYYLSNNDDSKGIIDSLKKQLKNALDLWNKMSDKDNRKSRYYKKIFDILNDVKEDITELGVLDVEEYYRDLNEIEYIRNWCISNNVEYDNESYELYVERFKFLSQIIGIDAQMIENNNIDEYIKIMSIDIPSDYKCYLLNYPDLKHYLLQGTIFFEVDSRDDFRAQIRNNGNWKSWQLINSQVRFFIEELNYCYFDNDEYYLLYNNTEKKYNYYNKTKKNEMLIFRLSEGYKCFAIIIQKVII